MPHTSEWRTITLYLNNVSPTEAQWVVFGGFVCPKNYIVKIRSGRLSSLIVARNSSQLGVLSIALVRANPNISQLNAVTTGAGIQLTLIRHKPLLMNFHRIDTVAALIDDQQYPVITDDQRFDENRHEAHINSRGFPNETLGWALIAQTDFANTMNCRIYCSLDTEWIWTGDPASRKNIGLFHQEDEENA